MRRTTSTAALWVAGLALAGCQGDDETPAPCIPSAEPIDATAFDVELDDVVYELPTPLGPHRVGTHLLHLTDSNRLETVTAEPDDVRELMVQLFYPTDVAGETLTAIMEDEVAEQMTTYGFLAGFHHQVGSHSQFDVPIASGGPWPVVIYSHGFGSYRFDNQLLLEELASRGFVVAAIGHTYSSAMTVFPDGRLATMQELPPLSSTSSLEDYEAFVDAVSQIQAEQWEPDVHFVVAELEALSASPECTWLSGQLDLERLAVIGYSLGGSTAYQACAAEPRCQVALNMDGNFFHAAEPAQLDRPMMFLTSRRYDYTWERQHAAHPAEAYTVRIAGMEHVNFQLMADLVVTLYPQVSLSVVGAGPIEPHRGLTIARDYVVALLETVVGHQPNALLEGPSAEHPEAVLEHSDHGISEDPVLALGVSRSGLGSCDNLAETGLIAGVEVAFADGSSTSSDSYGAWQLGPIPDEPLLAVTFDHPDLFPALRTVRPTGRFSWDDSQCLPEAGELEALAAETGQTLAADRGHVLLHGFVTSSEAVPILGIGELVVSAPSGEVVYLDADRALVADAVQTVSAAGWAAVLNVEPGTVSLTLDHPERQCAMPEARDHPGSAELIVEPGRVTMATVFCE